MLANWFSISDITLFDKFYVEYKTIKWFLDIEKYMEIQINM